MDKPQDHGGSRADNPYCKYCTDEQGNLLPRETVRENMIKYHTDVLNKPREEAERFVDEQMKTLPAWQAMASEPMTTAGIGMMDQPDQTKPISPGGPPPSTSTDQPTTVPGAPMPTPGGSQPQMPTDQPVSPVTDQPKTPTETPSPQPTGSAPEPTPGMPVEEEKEEPTV